jgi:Glycosyltransferase family 87
MLFKDIDIFVLAARAVLSGQNPYLLPQVEVFYPLPFYFLFFPLTGLPFSIVHVLWGGINALVYVAILRRRSLAAVLSIQVLLTFLLGQIDIVMMGLIIALRSGVMGGIVLAFLILKPQLVLLLAPWMLWQWWRGDRRQILWFVLTLGVMAAASFAAQPDWATSLFNRSGERVRARLAASIWGLLSFLPATIWVAAAGLLTVVIVVWAWHKNDFDIVAASGLLISPLIFSYNLTPLYALLRGPRLLIALSALSWLVFVITSMRSNDGPSAIITVAVLMALLTRSSDSRPAKSSLPRADGVEMTLVRGGP